MADKQDMGGYSSWVSDPKLAEAVELEPEGTPMGDFQKLRTDALSEMFEGRSANGIYPITRFFVRLDAWARTVLAALREAQEALACHDCREYREMMEAKLREREETIRAQDLHRKDLEAEVERLKGYMTPGQIEDAGHAKDFLQRWQKAEAERAAALERVEELERAGKMKDRAIELALCLYDDGLVDFKEYGLETDDDIPRMFHAALCAQQPQPTEGPKS